MISHKHKCIFIHIPKVAGTSIETFFLDDLELDFEDKHSLLLGKSTNMYLPPKVISHLTATEMISQHYISEELFNEYFKFALVRNPINRLFSTYKYWGFETVISFDTFIKYSLEKLIKNKKYSFFLQSQTTFLYNKTKEDNLMDFIGKFENIKHDFERVATKLEFSNSTLKHKNKGESHSNLLRGIKRLFENPKLILKVNFSNNKQRLLSKNAKNIVLKYYDEDFKNFNYNINL